MNNDLISRSELTKAFEHLASDDYENPLWYESTVFRVIDNAPTVETDIEVVAKDAYKQGYTDGWKERFGEPDERPQG